ncbi:hypothetical protein ACJMK2_007007 [Sinanodonta woodiana]|uniref:CUB domain-containing protein n=1 Tax=Sinanodonta woodiana TaxID=1069815 RepID=A0ABD3VH43_SINWO
MNILHLALCLSCLTEVSALTGNETECSSRCETGAGGYFKLEKDTMKRIQVSKGFHVKMFVMSSKSIFDVEVVECSVGKKSLVGGFNRNLETYESKENEIEVRVNAYSTQLDIQWWRVCGGSVVGYSGKLIGPDHASGYPENQTCIWNITVLNGYMLLLNLSIQGYNESTNCSLDYIQVMEIESEEMISRGPICSGMLNWTSNTSIQILFRSDFDSTSGLSFYASWVSKCGDTFYADNGELASPDISVDFSFHVQCNWTISVSPGHTIVINYTFPKTSNRDAGCKSYVQVMVSFTVVLTRRCFAKRHTTCDMKENIYNSLNEIDTTAENCKQQIREKNFNPETFRRRLPTLPTNRLSKILGRVRKGIQLRNEIYDTVHGERNDGFHLTILGDHTEPHTINQKNELSEEEIISIRNESTLDNFRNVGYISADNIDQSMPLSVSSTKIIKTDCLINKSAIAMIDNEDNVGPVNYYLTHVDDNGTVDDNLTPNDNYITLIDDNLTPNDNYITPIDDNLTPMDIYLISVGDNLTPVDNYITPVCNNLTLVDNYLTQIGDNLTPVDNYLTPVDDNLPPVDNYQSHVDDNLTPVDDYLSPVGDNLTPVDNYIIPVDDNLTPADDYLTPVDDNLTPADDYLTPVDDNLTPADDYLTPVDDNLTPVDDYITPVDDNLTHVDDYIAPLDGCLTHVGGSAVSADK